MTKNTTLYGLIIVFVLIGGFFSFNSYIRHEELAPGRPAETGNPLPQASGKVVATDTQSTANPLFGTSWSWVETILLNGEHVKAPAGDKFVLTFGEDGHVKSTTDCNGMNGSYIINGEVLSFGPMMSTKMFCEGSQEGNYSEALALTNSYVIEGSELHFNLNRDYGMMVFVKK